MPQFQDKETKRMAGIRLSTLPVFKLGREVTDPMVTIADNGQISFNKLCVPAFHTERAYVAFDEKTRALSITTLEKLPKSLADKGWVESDLLKLHKPTEGKGKKDARWYASCSAILKSIKYDYKASGGQVFKAQVNAEKHVVSFVVPEGALPMRPKQKRTPRAKATAPTAAAPAAQAASAGGEEALNLD